METANHPNMELPTEKYPRFAEKVSLHLFPSQGFVICSDPPQQISVSKDTMAILSLCNGASRFGEIIDIYLNSADCGNEAETCAAFITLANILRVGLLKLEDSPKPTKAVITGSRSTYFPNYMQIEITVDCNLRCNYCYRDAGVSGAPGGIETEDLFRILGAMAEKGLQGVELTGGEPCLHPDFLEIISFCGEKFGLVGLLTNGTLVTEALATALLPFREKLVISVSLDSHRREVHDARRGRQGAFEATCKGIEVLSRMNFLNRVSMSVDQDNWPDVEGTLLLARELGATLFTYSPILPLGRAKASFAPWNIHAREVSETAKNLANKYGGFLHFLPEDTFLELTQAGGCGAGHRVYAMDSQGQVRPCVTFDENMAIFGNLNRQSPDEVFGGELPVAFANVAPPHPEVCSPCKYALFCQHCSLRGLMASEWVGEENCSWLRHPDVMHWSSLVKEHTSTASPA